MIGGLIDNTKFDNFLLVDYNTNIKINFNRKVKVHITDDSEV